MEFCIIFGWTKNIQYTFIACLSLEFSKFRQNILEGGFGTLLGVTLTMMAIKPYSGKYPSMRKWEVSSQESRQTTR